jgi:hypothetical protein
LSFQGNMNLEGLTIEDCLIDDLAACRPPSEHSSMTQSSIVDPVPTRAAVVAVVKL